MTYKYESGDYINEKAPFFWWEHKTKKLKMNKKQIKKFAKFLVFKTEGQFHYEDDSWYDCFSKYINKGGKMKNKISQWLIDYVKKKNGVDLTNVPSDKSWTELNPFRDSTRLSDNVIKFINEKNLSGIKSSMDLVEEQSDKAAKEQRELNTINKGDE